MEKVRPNFDFIIAILFIVAALKISYNSYEIDKLQESRDRMWVNYIRLQEDLNNRIDGYNTNWQFQDSANHIFRRDINDIINELNTRQWNFTETTK